MPKINRTKYAVLGMLCLTPMSGYDLKKAFGHSISHFWNEDYGHIYPVLKTLVQEGLATRIVEPGEGRPDRHVYVVTDRGRAELDRWLLLPSARPNLRIELLLKVFFGSRVPKGNLLEKLREERRYCEETLAVFAGIEAHIREAEAAGGVPWKNPGETHFQFLSLRYGVRYYEAVRDWCDETIRDLEGVE